MPLSSLLYISRSSFPPADAEIMVGQIVAAARAWNADFGVTGALLFTGTHFAQQLEGEAQTIDTLLDRLRRDSRHDQLMIVDRRALAERHFSDWTMAYHGPSQFVSGHVTRLLIDSSPADRRRAVAGLSDLMREFAGHEALVSEPSVSEPPGS